MSTSKRIAGWMSDQVSRAGARGIVLGLSGGIDSAVVAGLAALAVPGQVVGVMMPCHSDPLDQTHAQLVADHFSIPALRLDLAPTYDRLVADLRAGLATLPADGFAAARVGDGETRLPLANVKPRLRMTSLYFVANSLNYLVAGTGNRSEIEIGYYTKYGDGGVDILPIASLFKSGVRALARELGVPQPVIDKPPSAGLWAGQTDESEMGFSYDDLERYLTDGPGAVAGEVAARIERLARSSDHKRTMPPAAG